MLGIGRLDTADPASSMRRPHRARWTSRASTSRRSASTRSGTRPTATSRTKLDQAQNEKLAELCAAQPDRFVAFASVALQYPDLAAQQLEHAVKKLGLRGAAIGGSVRRRRSSPIRNFIRSGRRPRSSAAWSSSIRRARPSSTSGSQGNGGLDNVIGNPLETTIALSHLIFEGTLDRFPGSKICAAHGGGYLPSYAARSDPGCVTFPDRCARCR